MTYKELLKVQSTLVTLVQQVGDIENELVEKRRVLVEKDQIIHKLQSTINNMAYEL